MTEDTGSLRPSRDVPAALREVSGVLTRAVNRVCPEWLRDHRDDIAQLAFMRLLKRHREGGGEVTNGYVYRVVHSVVIDEIRRRRRRPEEELAHDAATKGDAAATGNPEAAMSGRQAGDAIRLCMAELSDDRRRAVTLHLQGHSTVEIAELMDWPAKKAENLIYRGLADLRSKLADRGVVP